MVWPLAVGFVACFVCAIFFGSMFVPLKRLNTRDGFFVQFVMGVAIFCSGLIVGAYDGYDKFYPLAMLGGFLWSTGNITAIPIINRIGMTVGMLLWSFTGLLSGWASGRFGWFGMKPEKPPNEFLNYTGLVLSLISTVMFAFVESTTDKKVDAAASDENSDSSTYDHRNGGRAEEDDLLGDDESTDRSYDANFRPPVAKTSNLLYRHRQRLLAIVGAVLAGLFYGLCFVPVIYVQDNYPDSPQEALSYVFAFTTGVIVSCTFYFIIYSAYMGNRPYIDPQLFLPAFLSGVFWAVAQTAFFVANETLSEAVSFPIISRFPGLVAAMWGVFYFKEIQGRKNLTILVAAMVVTIIGGIFCGLSKVF